MFPSTDQQHTLDRLLREHAESGPFSYVFFWGGDQTEEVTKTCFSQWYPSDFTIDGVTYHFAEQYMMAKKAEVFGDEAIKARVMEATHPKKMKQLGKKVKGFTNEVWDLHKRRVVTEGNIAKFTQNPELRRFLVGTGDAVLVEASPYDRVWGIGMRDGDEGIDDPTNWNGTNLLGFVLMDVRDLLLV